MPRATGAQACQESFAQPGKNWFYLLYSRNSIYCPLSLFCCYSFSNAFPSFKTQHYQSPKPKPQVVIYFSRAIE